jgi:hypothetical protein
MSGQKLGKKEFEDFVNKLSEMGILNENTASNLRVVSVRMLPYIPDDISADKWNLEDIVKGFAAENTVPEKTQLGYLSRLKSAVRKFIAYANGTLSTKPRTLGVVHSEESNAVEVKIFSLPIPLRSDLILTIDKLPRDLTVDEAERIATIVKSFAVKN